MWRQALGRHMCRHPPPLPLCAHGACAIIYRQPCTAGIKRARAHRQMARRAHRPAPDCAPAAQRTLPHSTHCRTAHSVNYREHSTCCTAGNQAHSRKSQQDRCKPLQSHPVRLRGARHYERACKAISALAKQHTADSLLHNVRAKERDQRSRTRDQGPEIKDQRSRNRGIKGLVRDGERAGESAGGGTE